MKKKILLAAAVLLISLAAWLLLSPRSLGNIRLTCGEPDSGRSAVTFSCGENGRVRVDFASEISGGSLDVGIYDAGGGLLYRLDDARELVAYYELPAAGEYTLAAEYRDFTGRFQVRVSEAAQKKPKSSKIGGSILAAKGL